MRHLKRGRKLNRSPQHRRAMMRNMVSALFEHGRITTTPAKAKAIRPFAEKLITLGKKGTLHARRRALSLLHNRDIVQGLFAEIAPRYADRPGGYCRILQLSDRRIGDAAPQAIIELVEEVVKSSEKSAPKAQEEATSEEAPAVEEKAEEKAEEPAAGESTEEKDAE